MNEQALYQAAIDKWGQAAQVLMAMEECGELVAALPQYFFRDRIARDALASEIADVEIMIGQLRLMVGDSLVDLAKVEKLMRLKAHLEAGHD
jgi:NTP pyrophosphatase (non-canonical NTP hydrolase)